MVRTDIKTGKCTLKMCMNELSMLIADMASTAVKPSGDDPVKFLHFLINQIGSTAETLLVEKMRKDNGENDG